MLAVLGVISTTVQYLLNRLVIKPQLDKTMSETMSMVSGKIDAVSVKIDNVASTTKMWALEAFPSKGQFERHIDLDNANHGEITRVLDSVVRDQEEDHSLLLATREDVIALKVHAGIGLKSV